MMTGSIETGKNGDVLVLRIPLLAEPVASGSGKMLLFSKNTAFTPLCEYQGKLIVSQGSNVGYKV